MLCTAFGLSIRSDITLPGAVTATVEVTPDLDIAYGPARRWAETVAWGPYRLRDADLFEFLMPGVARYRIEDRRRVIITPLDGADEDSVAGMLVATVLPCLLWARGEIMLHASAIARPGSGSGILFMGPSGAGKSTRLQRAVDRGARVIAEDSVRLRLQAGEVLASGLPAGVFVRRQHSHEERDFVSVPQGQQLIEYRVGRILVLEPGARRARRLGVVETMAALLRYRHRPRILRLLGSEADFIDAFGLLAKGLRTTTARSGGPVQHVEWSV